MANIFVKLIMSNIEMVWMIKNRKVKGTIKIKSTSFG